MSSGGSKPPPAPDPQRIIELQNQFNRTNTVNPFGSSYWSKDQNGHETVTTTPSEQMQAAINRAFALSATPSQKLYVPQGMDQLASAIMGRVGARYGLGNGNANNPTIGFGAQGGNTPTTSVYGVSPANPDSNPNRSIAPIDDLSAGNTGMGGGQPFNTNMKQQYQAPPPYTRRG